MKDLPGYDPTLLLDVVKTKMPFGKYQDVLLYKLPVSYLEWFASKGFPKGRLGQLLELMHVIKTNGLEYLLKPLIYK